MELNTYIIQLIASELMRREKENKSSSLTKGTIYIVKSHIEISIYCIRNDKIKDMWLFRVVPRNRSSRTTVSPTKEKSRGSSLEVQKP